MVNEFTREPVAQVPKTRYRFTPTLDTTSEFFLLAPTFNKVLVPGDKINSFNVSCFGRAISLQAPILNKIRIRHDIFFVSFNSMDEEFKHFLPRVSPDQSNATNPNNIAFPTIDKFNGLFDSNGNLINNLWKSGKLLDRLGIKFCDDNVAPEKTGILSQVSAFSPFAYQRICDKYFTNFDLQTNNFLDTEIRDAFTTPVGTDLLNLRYANWSYDYFTSALPWVQRFPSPEIDLTNAFIKTQSFTNLDSIPHNLSAVNVQARDTVNNINDVYPESEANYSFIRLSNGSSPEFVPSEPLFVRPQINTTQIKNLLNSGRISAEITGTSVTLTDLRDSMILQMMLEAQARGGSRYDEMSLTMYGTAPSNEVLHEPLWLGGFTQNLMTSEVVATSANNTSGSYLGNLAGHGITSDNGHLFHNFDVKEFGVLMMISRIYPEQIYSQGVPREQLYLDYYSSIFNPMFNNMSNQPVYEQELYNNDTKIDIDSDNHIFGFNGIYDFMRTMENSVSGDLRNNNLRYWLATRDFNATPQLNENFINGENSISALNNIFAVTNTDPFILHFDFEIEMLRPIPAVAVPKFTI